jgi:hypothetical protein
MTGEEMAEARQRAVGGAAALKGATLEYWKRQPAP